MGCTAVRMLFEANSLGRTVNEQVIAHLDVKAGQRSGHIRDMVRQLDDIDRRLEHAILECSCFVSPCVHAELPCRQPP
jgi:hypothetical protein